MGTKYNYVKNNIRSKLLEGFIIAHQKIGSENELMKEYHVSRHTIRKAIDDLVNEGLLYRKQGAGTFCADRSLHVDRSQESGKNIAVITTYFSDYIFPSIIRGIEGFLSEKGYHMTVFSTNNNPEQEKRCLESILSQNYDGLIVEPTKSALPNPNINYYLNIERVGIPYVMINAYYEELEPVHIMIDDILGGMKQTEHLIDLGHKHIVGIFKNDDIQGTKRMKGFIKAHRKANLPISPHNIITYTTETKHEEPHQKLKKLLQGKELSPTGIVCYNDELALKFLDIVREMELTTPNDISIVGYDDSFLSVASEVKLTTITHPKVDMGVAAGKKIIQLIQCKQENSSLIKEAESSIIYTPELVLRNSTKSIEMMEMK
ncbi:GntR family transcriptional regulator [Salipaludibacillus neizhouensis]|uniref:GntR family transcriptional regulator n=1 Tax=Salipaludibacillus neizhouensis TaxID=885475 RepID=A0A3A9KGS7_9BACI|nr:GntR family transcriptional regulator [Salipaludibacillus neizhouensis]RKL66835.1 GntR family transcriptional regulator [Salipaludibacillus neizhouensis]